MSFVDAISVKVLDKSLILHGKNILRSSTTKIILSLLQEEETD